MKVIFNLLGVTVVLFALGIQDNGAVRFHKSGLGTSHSSKGNEFYLGFMQNRLTVDRLTAVPLYITTDEPHTVNFSVTAINPKFIFYGNVSYGNVTTVHLPRGVIVLAQRTAPGREKLKGVYVKAEDGKTISVIGSNAVQATTDSFVALPAVDNPLKVRERYTIISNDFERLSSIHAIVYSEFLLVGSRNNTKVRITANSNSSIEVPSIYNPSLLIARAGQQVEFTLNWMETLLITSTRDLTGTVISSNEPISVFTGHECGQVPANVGTCDHLVEQVPPQHTWGVQFFTAPLKRESGDLFKMATTNAIKTEVNITCTEMGGNRSRNTFRALSLGRNEIFSFEQGPLTFCCIESTNPLLVMQLGKGSSLNSGLGDPLLVTVPAVQQYANNFTIVQDLLSSDHYLNIIVPVQYFNDTQQGHSRIRINNNTASRSWTAILCSTGQICAYGAQVLLKDPMATVLHEDPKAGISVSVYGFGNDVAYGYSAGYNLDPIAFAIVSLEPGEHTLYGTSGNVTLVITRRGNIHVPLTLHLISDYIDPVEVNLLRKELRREVTITVRTETFPTVPEFVTVLLTYSGDEDVILRDNEANITILKGIEVGFQNSSVTVDEGVKRVTLTIVTSIPNPQSNLIKIRTLPGTAQSGEDYESIDSVVTLAPMEQVLEYDIIILDDQRVERQEVFSVLLEIAPGQDEVSGLTLGQSRIEVFIKDNDCIIIFLEQTNITLQESESSAIVVVHKEGLSELTTSVLLSTKDLSASAADLDYQPLSGTTVVFQPEDTERSIHLKIIDDDIVENDEQFLLQLSPNKDEHVCLNQSTIATITILDDDVVTFRFQRAEYSFQEDAGLVTLSVLKEGTHEGPTTVLVQTQSQSAQNGTDYVGVNKALTFQPGQSVHTVSIQLIDDGITEDNEYFIASLIVSEAGTQAPIPQDTVITIIDNDDVEIGLSGSVYKVVEGDGKVRVIVESVGGGLERNVSVLLSTKDGSAKESADYSGYSEIVEFVPGVSMVNVDIPILADNSYEELESFTVELRALNQSNQSGVKIDSSRSTARVDIIDDDTAVGFSSREYTVTESDEFVQLLLFKRGQLRKEVELHYVTELVHQSHGNSSLADLGSEVEVTFGEEDTVLQLLLPLVDDDVVEANEVIQVQLSVAVGDGIELMADTATITIIDDDEAVFQFDPQNTTISESEGNAVIHIHKAGVAAIPLTVIFSTVDFQAKELEDYTSKMETVTFQYNETWKSVTVDIVDDAIYEGSESFKVSLRSASSGVAVDGTPGWITILDEDDFVTLRFVSSQVLVEESDGSAQIVVTKIGHSAIPVVVTIHTEDSTAKAVADYLSVTMEMVFTPEDIVKSFNVTVISDEVFESMERFDVVLSLMDDMGNSRELDRLSVIISDSSSGLVVALNAAKNVIMENGREMVFTVSVIGQLEREISLQFSTDDINATAGSDYESISLSLTLSPDQLAVSFSVPIIDDNSVERGEVFRGVLSSSLEQVTLINSTIDVTILDDDKVCIKFNQVEYKVSEEEGIVTLSLSKEGMNDIPIHITVSTEDGNATKYMDYLPVIGGLITFGPRDSIVNFNVTLVNDDVLEDDEVFHVLLAATVSQSSYVKLEDYNASVTITDQDMVTIGFSQAGLSVNEADGPLSLMIVKEGDSEIDIEIEIQLEDASATGNLDYIYEGHVTSLQPDDELHSVNITIIDDEILEATETFTARLRVLGNQVGINLVNSSIPVSIIDNDYVVLTFDSTIVAVHEDEGMLNLTITKQGAAAIPITMVISTQPQEAKSNEDYVALSESVVIEPEQMNITVTVPILNDGLLEGNESFSVELVTGRNVIVNEGHATVWIIDDDVAQVGFQESQYLVPEGNESTEVCITTSIPVDFDLDIFIVAMPLTASLGVDFVLLTAQVTLRGGSGQCLTVDIVSDLTTEGIEQFQLQLYLNDTNLQEMGLVALTSDTTTVSIIDDDRVHIGFEASSYSVKEGDLSVDVCVIIKTGHIKDTAIQVNSFTVSKTAKIDEDFVVNNSKLVFTDIDVKQCITVVIIDDAIIEMNEQLMLGLELPGASEHYELLQGNTVVMIEDNDDIEVGFALDAYSVFESEGEISVKVVLDRPSVPRFPIPISIEATSHDADELADWSIENSTFILTDRSYLLSITIVPDNSVETNETFSLALHPHDPRPGFKPKGGETMITILDINYATLSYEFSSYSADEDVGVLELSIVLVEGNLERNISLIVSAMDLDAHAVEDFAILDAAVMFPDGSRAGDKLKVDVKVVDDQLVEHDEQFWMEISSEDERVQFITKAAQITIINNDVINVKFESDSYAVSEGEETEVCVVFETERLKKDVHVSVVSRSDTAIIGQDYNMPSMLPLTLNPGTNHSCFAVDIIEDILMEGEETFQLILTSSDQAILMSITDVLTVHIEDNDVARFGLDGAVYTVAESDDLIVSIYLLENELAVPVPLEIKTTDISASIDMDYTLHRMFQLIFRERSKPGDHKNITIAILPDAVVENQESFLVLLMSLSSLAEIKEGRNSTIAIIQDTTTIDIGFEMLQYFLPEGASHLTVCLRLQGGRLDRAVNVTLSTRPGTALANADYSSDAIITEFLPADNLTCVDIVVTDDKAVEKNESFALFLSTTEPAINMSPNMTTVTIIDNDKITLALSQSHVTVQESDRDLEIVVELFGDLQREVVVLLESMDRTASFLHGDYAGFSELLTFRPGSRTGSVVSYTATLEDDHVVEDLEYFVVHATSLDEQVQFEPHRENITIYIEDNDVIGIMLESTSYSVMEGSRVDVCVMLSGELEREVPLSLTTQPGTAELRKDYADITSVLHLLSGDGRVCFSVETLEDDIMEGDEILQVVLNGNDSVFMNGNIVNVTIKDNDNAVFGLKASWYTVGDDESNITITIYVVDKELALSVELQLTSLDISARNGGDYIFVPTTVRFPPGSKPGDVIHVTIAILPDSVVENTESFQLLLSSLNPLATIDERMRNSTVDITDKNTIDIGFEQTSYTIQEGATQLQVCIVIEGGALARPVDLVISSRDITAQAPDDYKEISYLTSFSHNDGARKCINVTVVDDDLVENTEIFQLWLTSKDEAVSLMSNQLTLMIVDNDKALLALEQTNLTVNESIGKLEVKLKLTGQLERNVIFSVVSDNGTALAQGGGDYSAISETLSFSPGNDSTISFFISIHDDQIVETQEYLSVRVESSDGAVLLEADKDTAYVFISDDDTIVVNFMSSSYSVSEGGTVEVCLILETGQLERGVELSLVSQSDTAQQGADYVALLLSITWEPSVAQNCFSVEVVDDHIVEGEETFQVLLASHDPAVIVATPGTAHISIQDNDHDSTVFGFEFSEYTVNEDANEVIVSVLLLETELAVPLSLQLIPSDISALNGEDYSLLTSVQVIFPEMSVPGDRLNISIVILADDVVESWETFKLTLASLSPSVSELDSSTITIIDQSETSIGFEKADYYVYENDTSVKVCVSRHGGVLSRQLNLTIASSTGSASELKDFSKLLHTMAFSESDGDRLCVNVTIIDDLLLENDEIFNLLLTSTDSAVSVELNMTTVTILDDDSVTLALLPMEFTIAESSQQVQITVVLRGRLEREVSLMLESKDGTASFNKDYKMLSDKLTFPLSNSVTSSLTVNVTVIDDLLVEGMEYFTVYALAMDTAAHFIPGRNSTTIHILDDDTIRIKFESLSYSVEEGAAVKVCIKAENGELERTVQLSIASISDSAEESDDYSPITLTLTLLHGESQSCFSVVTLDDDVVEGEEAFTVVIRSQDKAVVTPTNTTIISIHDSDHAVFGLEFPMYFIKEKDESTVVSILLLEKDLGSPVTLQLSTSDLTAIAGVDYVASSKLITFPIGSKSGDKQNISFTSPLMDSVVENTESFEVHLSTISSMATVRSDAENATVYIADQSSISIGFEESHYYVTENQSQIEICLVLQSGHLDRPVNLLVCTHDESAHSPMDYTKLILMTTLEGDAKCIEVGITADKYVESNETFLVSLNSSDIAVSLSLLPVMITIINDDHATIAFQHSQYRVPENSGQLDLVIKLTGFIEKNVSLIVDIQDRTASASRGDYSARTSESKLVFPSGSMSGSNLTLTFDIGDDNLVEEEELFIVSLRSLDVDIQIEEVKNSAQIFIEDDDSINVRLESASYFVVEGETVKLCTIVESGELEKSIELEISIVGQSDSDQEEDYKVKMSTFSLKPAQNQTCTTVEILNDNLVEGNETFQVILSSTDSAVTVSTPNTAIITIEDANDVVLGFKFTDYFISESDGSLTLSVVLLHSELRIPTPVLLTAEDISATNGIDYVFMDTTLIFPSHSKPGYIKNVTVVILTDIIVESTEFIQVHLSSIGPHTTIDSDKRGARVGIYDQTVVTAGFEVSEYSLHEGMSSLEVCILLEGGQLHRPVNIALSSSDRTAVAQLDYAGLYLAEFTPSDGNMICIDVTIRDDTVVERDESFTLALNSSDRAVRIISDSATVTIIDNDQAIVGFMHNSYTVIEEVGHLEVGIQLLDGQSLEREIIVYVESSDESALSVNGDYAAFRRTLTFPQGSLPGTILPLEITILDDTMVEDLEYFTLHIGTTDHAVQYQTGKQNSTVYIKDDDSISLVMESSVYTVTEGEMVEICMAVQRGELETTVQFSIFSRPASAQEEDYNSIFRSVSLSPGENRVCLHIETIDDSTVEGKERFHLILSSPNPAVNISTPNMTLVTIRDNDAIDVRLESASYTVSEGGTIEVCAVVENGQFERNVELFISSQPGSAQEEDYVVIYMERIILQPHNKRSCIRIEIKDDDLVEGVEAFQVTITTSDTAAVITTPSTSTVQIIDNDYARFGFKSSEYSFSEGPDIQSVVVVLLEHELTSPISVQFTVADSSATWGTDYDYQQESVTFLSGEKSGDTHSFYVDINRDAIVEATESFQLYLSCQSHLASIDGRRRVSTVYITDQTTAMIGFERAQYEIREDTPQLTVCLTLQDGRELARPVDFAVSSSDGSAQAPGDYSSVELTTSFDPSHGHRKCLQLEIVDDWRLEDSEVLSLSLTLTDPSIFLGLVRTSVTILDNDRVIVGLKSTHYTIEESVQQIEVTVELLGDIERDVSVVVESEDGTAFASDGDYIPFLEVLTFSKGSSSGSIRSARVYVLDDPLVERLEYFTVHLSPVDIGVQIQQSREDATIFIINDDVISSDVILLPVEGSNGDDSEQICTKKSGCSSSDTRSRSKSKKTRASHSSKSKSRTATRTTKTKKSKKTKKKSH